MDTEHPTWTGAVRRDFNQIGHALKQAQGHLSKILSIAERTEAPMIVCNNMDLAFRALNEVDVFLHEELKARCLVVSEPELSLVDEVLRELQEKDHP